MAFSPDGTRLATGDFEGVVEIWNAWTGEKLLSLPRQVSYIYWVAFSPDGSLLATASGDGIARLWDASSGVERLTLRGHTGDVESVIFSPDGARLATASTDGTARVYLLKIDELIELARSRLTRSFTTEECQKYLHMEQCPAER